LTVDDLIQKAKAFVEFVGSCFLAVRALMKTARVPPGCINVTAEQMTINYKSVAVSMILLFLARALEGVKVNDFLGSVLVVTLFVGLVLALKYGADVLALLTGQVTGAGARTDDSVAPQQWLSLLVAVWSWSLFVVLLHGLAASFLGTVDLNLFFGTSFFIPVAASAIALLIVAVKTKYFDGIDLGSPRTVAICSALTIGFVALAVWVTIFSRWI
jgi:hypothetical protein